MLETAVRASGRAKQEIVARVGPLRVLGDTRHQRRVQRFVRHMPALAPDRAGVLDEVRSRGASVTSLAALALPGTDDLTLGAQELLAELAGGPRGDQSTVRHTRERLLELPAVWQWGLSGPLLDMVENYLGLPARYLGADLRCERATGEAVGVRQWHRDIEDHRMLKLLVWLNDVDDQGGPFEFIDRAHTAELTRSMRYVSGYVHDEAVDRLVPSSERRRAIGPKWTCVVADPRNVFHRAMPPTRDDRYSLTFSFTSRTPRRTLPALPVSRRERQLATRGLNPRQLACLPRRYTK